MIPNLDKLAATAALLVDDAPDKAHADAANKAMWFLSKGVDVIETHGGFLIPSGTRGGMVHRVSLTGGCSCEAALSGKPCWHYACVVIIEQTRELAGATIEREAGAELLASQRNYEKACADINDLYA